MQTRDLGQPFFGRVVADATAALSWIPLSRALIACNGGRDGDLARALGGDWKSAISPLIYLSAIVLAFFMPILACGLYAVVAALWFIPDRRIEKHMVQNKMSEV